MKIPIRRRGSSSLAAIARHASRLVREIGGRAAALALQMPATLGATVGGGVATTRALQRLPDPMLRWLAAGSIGLGAGLYLSGTPRPVVAATGVPAVLIGAAILLRPVARTPSRQAGAHRP